MKKQNAKGFGARPSAVAYYVVVPTSVPGRTLEVGPIASRAVANNYAKVVSASPDFAGLAIGVKEVTV